VSNERPARVSSAAIKAGNFDAFVEEVSVPVETSIGSW
jgi:hypothetical protein